MEASQPGVVSVKALVGAVVVLASVSVVVEDGATDESASISSTSGAVGSVMPASLSASMAGRVRSWRLLM